MSDLIGRTLGHYRIVEKIGAGGMGEVYLAEDLKLERNVAIKFLPQHLTIDKDNVERFEREAKAAASLNHPNIVTIHEIAEVDDPATAGKQTFIVMEYVDGKSLREYVGAIPIKSGFSSGSVAHSVNEILSIINQIAEGLSKAHQAGIVHRDIKSANIMVTEERKIKIMDFGLAKIRGGAEITKEQSTLGTVAYMSPEQTRGEETDHRSDIWSYGVVLYEMVTGQLPFKGDYDQAIVYSILNETPKSVDSLISEEIPGIENIINNCLIILKGNFRGKYQSCSTPFFHIRNPLAHSRNK